MTNHKMKVEIWSDITCPFCYIGKRKLESALSQFKDAANIELVWKSFELAPGFKTQPDQNMHQFLADHKEITLQQSIEMSDSVASAAKQVGLEFNFHKAIPTNSFKAHRFSYLAKSKGLQDQAKEILFNAYFKDGQNIDDDLTLMRLGKEIGLDTLEVKNALESNKYADKVQQDLDEAKHRAVTSVPFYMFNNKSKISGALESNAFLEMLEKTFDEWQKELATSTLEITGGQSCKIGGNC